tara:strand:+ start:294 stop:941 length:648 start_codon:yes stop_codon:yes gene_type:complete
MILLIDTLSKGYTHAYFNTAIIENYLNKKINIKYKANILPKKIYDLKSTKPLVFLDFIFAKKIIWLRFDIKYFLVFAVRKIILKKDELIIHNDLDSSQLRTFVMNTFFALFLNFKVIKSIVNYNDSKNEITHPVLKFLPKFTRTIKLKEMVSFGRHSKNNKSKEYQNKSSFKNYYNSLANCKVVNINYSLVKNRASGVLAECQNLNKLVLLYETN